MKLILATTKDGIIAKDGKIPWNLPEDLKFFSQMTMGTTVVMGRKTFESIGRLLPNRENIMIGKSHTSLIDAISQIEDLEKQNKPVWCIGGAQIALRLFPYIQEAYLSVLNNDIVDLTSLTSLTSLTYAPRFIIDCLDIINNFHQKTLHREMKRDKYAVRVFKKYDDFTVYHCSFRDNEEERNCQRLVSKIMTKGSFKNDRTKIGIRYLFGEQLSFSLENNRFPMSTLRKAFFKGIFEEMMWFLRGQTDSSLLSAKGVKIWDDNSSEEALKKANIYHLSRGDCGAIYGFQWRHWGEKYIDCKTDYTGKGHDQIANLVREIRENPNSRRLILSGWNVSDLSEMCLPPCHTLYQFDVCPADDGGASWLSCHYYQRSSDFMLAGHWNITSASLLTILLAHFCGLRPKRLTVSYGNVHVYSNHSVDEYLRRCPFEYPQLHISPQKERLNLWDYEIEDCRLENYSSHPHINLNMNV